MVDSKKPKVISIKKNVEKEEEDAKEFAEEFSDLVDDLPVSPLDTSRNELRKKQLEDLTPINLEEEFKKEKKKRLNLL